MFQLSFYYWDQKEKNAKLKKWVYTFFWGVLEILPWVLYLIAPTDTINVLIWIGFTRISLLSEDRKPQMNKTVWQVYIRKNWISWICLTTYWWTFFVRIKEKCSSSQLCPIMFILLWERNYKHYFIGIYSTIFLLIFL